VPAEKVGAAIEMDAHENVAAVEKTAPAVAPQAADDRALVAQAQRQLDRGAAQKALALARQAADANPKNADAWLITGAAQQQLGHDHDAKTAYARYLELAPNGSFAREIRSIVRTLQ